MNPYILQSVAAERTRDLRQEAAAAWRAKLARRACGGGVSVQLPEIFRRGSVTEQPSGI
jgi:hypothetical protein